MSFKLTWTGPTGSDQIEVETAADALREFVTRNRNVVNMVVKDNHGRRVKPDELVALVAMSGNADDA